MSNGEGFETRGMRPAVAVKGTLRARMGLLAIAVAVLAAMGVLALTEPAEAATSTIPDGDEAALVSAINAANGSAGPDTITLATDGTYNLTQADNEFFGANGLPAIGSQITIEGNGAKFTRTGAQIPKFRFFYVRPSGNLTLRDVELIGGRAVGGHGANSSDAESPPAGAGGGAAGMGGAVFNAGTLSVERSTLLGNTAEGGFGGGGGLGFVENGGGGGGVAGDAFGSGNGGPGSYSEDGGCSAYHPYIVCYQPGVRYPHGGNGGPGGGGGAGYQSGEGGYGGFGGGGGGGYEGGRGGHGGGYAPHQNGGPGVPEGTGFGGGGGGGGIFYNPYSGVTSRGGPGEGGFGGGDGLDGAGGGGGGFGGAIFNHAGTLTITNSTVAYNDAVGGLGGSGESVPGEDGLGLGGGLFNRNGSVTIQSSTFTNNVASTLRPDRAATTPGGTGGGIYHFADYLPGILLTMNDTIVANSAGIPPEGSSVNDYQAYARNGGAPTEGGSNLVESKGDDGAWFAGPVITADPKLGPGYEPGPGSPAIDAAGTDCPATDARRVARPQDGDANGTSLCDIGAFEIAPPPNDDFANAETISGDDASVGGTTRAATREPGEPDHYTPVSGDSDWVGEHSVWYRWTAPYSGSAAVDTCQANTDSILAVYTGDRIDALRRVADNNNHPDCPSGSWGSKLTFGATAGETYRIAVGDAGGLRQNAFTLKLELTDDAPPDTTITSGPPTLVNSGSADFTFESTEANSTFKCKLDSRAGEPCTSTKSYTDVRHGSHTFEVRATDRAGNVDGSPATHAWTVDLKKPRVSRVVPAEDAADIGPGANVLAVFSEPMRAGSVVAAVKLYKAGEPTALRATVTYDAATRRATLNPDAKLLLGARYKAVVSTVAKDTAGNRMDQDPNLTGYQAKVWFFRVRN